MVQLCGLLLRFKLYLLNMGYTTIPPALEQPTASFTGEQYINVFRFMKQHPYVVSDGRRFSTLELAADTAYGIRGTVTDAAGKVHSWEECRAIAGRRRRIHA